MPRTSLTLCWSSWVMQKNLASMNDWFWIVSASPMTGGDRHYESSVAVSLYLYRLTLFTRLPVLKFPVAVPDMSGITRIFVYSENYGFWCTVRTIIEMLCYVVLWINLSFLEHIVYSHIFLLSVSFAYQANMGSTAAMGLYRPVLITSAPTLPISLEALRDHRIRVRLPSQSSGRYRTKANYLRTLK